MLDKHHSWLAALSLLAGAAGCSSAAGPDDEVIETSEQEIIGGFPVNTSLADAIGALGVYFPESTEEDRGFIPVCTASLISRDTVLTAKHCIALVEDGWSLAFGVGWNGNDPKEVVPIVSVLGAPGDEGGQSGFGRDLGLGKLERSIRNIQPLSLGTLRSRDVGKTFSMVGYGDQDDGGPTGTRQAGFIQLLALEGKILQLVYPTFEDFYQAHIGEPPPSGCDCAVVEDDACALSCELQAEYDNASLEKGYEALLGGEHSAELCFGDSGGPLLGVQNDKPTIFATAVLTFGDGSGSCHDSKGAIYTTFGPEIQEFIAENR
jgi:hypothetical protein